jgi:hypothetical protein
MEIVENLLELDSGERYKHNQATFIHGLSLCDCFHIGPLNCSKAAQIGHL